MGTDARVRELESQLFDLQAALADKAEVVGQCWRGGPPVPLRPILKEEGLFWRCTHDQEDGGPHESKRVDR